MYEKLNTLYFILRTKESYIYVRDIVKVLMIQYNYTNNIN